MYPLYLIDKQIKSFLNNQFSNNDTFKDNLKKIIFLTTNLALRKRLANCVKYFAEPRTSISFHLYLKEALVLVYLKEAHITQCSEIFCCLQIYLCRMLIPLHWRNNNLACKSLCN